MRKNVFNKMTPVFTKPSSKIIKTKQNINWIKKIANCMKMFGKNIICASSLRS